MTTSDHDLHVNPLAPILNSLEILKLSGGAAQACSVMERQVSHLNRLVDDLLEVSRITRGVIDVKKEPQNLVTPADPVFVAGDAVRLTQVDRSARRAQGGLGIGLTLVKSLVTIHGGRVEARSDGPGLGSQFEVRLPAIPAVAATQEVTRRAQAMPSRRILIVDDSRDGGESLSVL